MKYFSLFTRYIDWPLFLSAVFIVVFGIFTMYSFTETNTFFVKQIVWLIVSILAFFVASGIDWKFLKKTKIVMIIYCIAVFFLLNLFIFGSVFKGARSWFDFGFFSFQPIDFVKISLIIVLSKYFSRRHIEIGHIKHILVSGFYVAVPFLLVFLQPDFGGAIVLFLLWLGMVLVSGISKKHLALVFITGILGTFVLWNFAFKDYQKQRIINFINPLADIRGGGYNVYQSTIAIGSGGMFGKGIGYGTQSKLEFLPEYETDFIFGAFAEEWGFVGVIILFILFLVLIYRIISISTKGETNFEILLGSGISIIFITHIILNIGMNIGLLPVTGNTLPFMSYGGSHLLNEFIMLGILTSLSRYKRPIHRDIASNEMVGVI
jgi:rod shape determining protein RodA